MDTQDFKISFDTQGLALSDNTAFFYIKAEDGSAPLKRSLEPSHSPLHIEPYSDFRAAYGYMLYLDRLEAFAAMYSIYQTRFLEKSISRANSVVELLSHEGVVDALDYGMVLQSTKETPFDAFSTYKQMCSATHSIIPMLDPHTRELFARDLELQPMLCSVSLPLTHLLGLQYMKLELESRYGIGGKELELLRRILDRLYSRSSTLQDWYTLHTADNPSALFSEPAVRAFLDQVVVTLQESTYYPSLRLVKYTSSSLELEYTTPAHSYSISFLSTPYMPELYPQILDASLDGFYCYQAPSPPSSTEWTLDSIIYSTWDSYRTHGIPHHQSLGPIGVKPY